MDKPIQDDMILLTGNHQLYYSFFFHQFIYFIPFYCRFVGRSQQNVVVVVIC